MTLLKAERLVEIYGRYQQLTQRDMIDIIDSHLDLYANPMSTGTAVGATLGMAALIQLRDIAANPTGLGSGLTHGTAKELIESHLRLYGKEVPA